MEQCQLDNVFDVFVFNLNGMFDEKSSAKSVKALRLATGPLSSNVRFHLLKNFLHL